MDYNAMFQRLMAMRQPTAQPAPAQPVPQQQPHPLEAMFMQRFQNRPRPNHGWGGGAMQGMQGMPQRTQPTPHMAQTPGKGFGGYKY